MKAVLVFCEGRHDVVFVRRSLGAVANGEFFPGKIRDLPAPFGSSGDGPGFIRMQYSSRELDDRPLALAAHARSPTFEAVVTLPDGTLCFLICCGGDVAAPSSIEVVKKVGTLVTKYSEPSGVDDVAFAFISDADQPGVGAREARFASACADCLSGQSVGHAGWAKGEVGPVGLFVFHDPSTRKGTLEDALAPMVSDVWPERWQAADVYLDTHATDLDPIRHKASEYKKAQIGVTGQFLFPGDPMTQLIDRDGLPRESFTGPVSQALVDFLRAVPW